MENAALYATSNQVCEHILFDLSYSSTLFCALFLMICPSSTNYSILVAATRCCRGPGCPCERKGLSKTDLCNFSLNPDLQTLIIPNCQLPAMTWSDEERLLDIGCGSGDVTRWKYSSSHEFDRKTFIYVGIGQLFIENPPTMGEHWLLKRLSLRHPVGTFTNLNWPNYISR